MSQIIKRIFLFSFLAQRSRSLFILMFSVVLLLNVNFSILRSVRNTLTVADIGGGAHAIPLFELFGALPGAILLTWALGKLMHRFSMQRVFLLVMGSFLGFFLLFSMVLYPWLLVGAQGEIKTISSLMFYVIAELWKTALMIILFWGLVNKYIPLEEAKSLYAPLMLGASLGSMLAGPFVSFCSSSWKFFPLSSQPWTHIFITLMIVVSLLGVLLGYLYCLLSKQLTFAKAEKVAQREERFSLRENISLCWRTPHLFLLCWIVMADYIAYSLGEVVFFDVLKRKYTSPSEYCQFMAMLNSWGGGCTLFFALFVNPLLLKHCRWVVAALATPICLLLLEGLFFVILRCETCWFNPEQWLSAVIFMGTLQFCLCRACKYTLLDASKELAFVMLPQEEKMKGKLVVDGICARLGRGGASVITLSLAGIYGGVIASSSVAGWIALGLGFTWFIATTRLGKWVDRLSSKKTEETCAPVLPKNPLSRSSPNVLK